MIHRQFDEARAQAAGDLPDGPFRGVPFLLKDLDDSHQAGEPYHGGTRFLQKHGYRPAADTELTAGSGGRPGHHRPHQHPGARPPAHHRARDLRRHPQPVGPDPLDRRLQRGLGRGGRRRHGADGPRRRRRWLDPHPGQRVRAGRPEAEQGPAHQRARRTRPGPASWPATWSAAPSGTPRPPSTSSPGPRRAIPTRRRPRPGRTVDEVGADAGALRVGWVVDDPGGGLRPSPPAPTAVEATLALLEAAGHRVEESAPQGLQSDQVIGHFTACFGAWTRARSWARARGAGRRADGRRRRGAGARRPSPSSARR